MKVTFYGTGQTTAFERGKQIPVFQRSWLLLYFEFVESKGFDPRSFVYEMDGQRFRPIKNEDGTWNYRID